MLTKTTSKWNPHERVMRIDRVYLCDALLDKASESLAKHSLKLQP